MTADNPYPLVERLEAFREIGRERGWLPMTPLEALAANVYRLRRQLRMTQEEVAWSMRLLGFEWNRTAVSRVEATTRAVTLAEVVGLSTVLAVRSPGRLLRGAG